MMLPRVLLSGRVLSARLRSTSLACRSLSALAPFGHRTSNRLSAPHELHASFSTSSHEQRDDKGQATVPWKDMNGFEKVKYVGGKYGLYILSGSVFAYVISKSSMYLTSTFMGLSFKTVGWYGFLVGFNSGLGTGLGVYLVSLGLTIRPEKVRAEAFRAVSRNREVQEAMGISILKPLQSGVMRAYSIEPGRFALEKESRKVAWRPPSIKMIFQVYGGNKQQAAVYVEAHRAWNGIQFDFLSVDVLTTKHDHTVLVEGDPKRMEVEGQLRDLVQLKRKYV